MLQYAFLDLCLVRNSGSEVVIKGNNVLAIVGAAVAARVAGAETENNKALGGKDSLQVFVICEIIIVKYCFRAYGTASWQPPWLHDLNDALPIASFNRYEYVHRGTTGRVRPSVVSLVESNKSNNFLLVELVKRPFLKKISLF
jgi:hypothetical protein